MERTFKIHVPQEYVWVPQPDITAYELALCVPLMSSQGFQHQYFSQLPPEAARHWKPAENG